VKLGLAAVIGIVCALQSSVARADEAPSFSRVALLMPACEAPGLSADELRSALTLDLRDGGVTLAPSGEHSPATDLLVNLEAVCEKPSELTLAASFQGKHHARRIDLGELPPAQRARVLSLSLAELLQQFEQPPPNAASGEAPPLEGKPGDSVAPTNQPPATPEPAPVPKQPAPKPPAPTPRSDGARDEGESHRSRADTSSRWQLSLAPELRAFETTTLWGAHAALRRGRWSAGLHLLTGQSRVEAGKVAILTPHASASYSLPLFGTPEDALLEAGPRLGAGRTFMTAEASAVGRANSAADVYLDAALLASYSLRLSPAWRGSLGAELGYARGPIGYGDDIVIARTSGLFASIWLEGALLL
jgi:hypothetical protein